MDNKIKKIIAREGLILLGILLLGSIIIWIAELLNYIFNPPATKDVLPRLVFEPFYQIIDIGKWVRIIGYPVYLVIKFIIWAIRALKQKS